jgi:hypothetical protein
MNRSSSGRGGRLWFVLIGCSVSAVALLRTGKVSSREPSSEVDSENTGLDYVCVADAAVPLRERDIEMLDKEEAKLKVRFSEASRRCRPPLVPIVEGSVPLGSGMSFGSGYGGMLSRFEGTKEQAIGATQSALEQLGWEETPASKKIRQIKKSIAARVFSREGAWLFAVATQGKTDIDDRAQKSSVFVAGQWRRDILEMLR